MGDSETLEVKVAFLGDTRDIRPDLLTNANMGNSVLKPSQINAASLDNLSDLLSYGIIFYQVKGKLTQAQTENLKTYVEQGGILFATAPTIEDVEKISTGQFKRLKRGFFRTYIEHQGNGLSINEEEYRVSIAGKFPQLRSDPRINIPITFNKDGKSVTVGGFYRMGNGGIVYSPEPLTTKLDFKEGNYLFDLIKIALKKTIGPRSITIGSSEDSQDFQMTYSYGIGIIKMGSSDDCNIKIPGFPPSCFYITYKEGSYYITPHQADSGISIMLNNKQLERETILPDGSSIQVETKIFTFGEGKLTYGPLRTTPS